MKIHQQPLLLSALVAATLVGCATPDNRPALHQQVTREVRRVEQNAAPQGPVVRQMQAAYVKARPIEYIAPVDEVSLRLAQGSLQVALESVAKPSGDGKRHELIRI